MVTDESVVFLEGIQICSLVVLYILSFDIVEFENTRSSAPPVRIRNISNKLCVIGKTYIKAERYFPFGKFLSHLNHFFL